LGLEFNNNSLQKLIINRCSDSFGQLVHCANNADRESFDIVIDLADESVRYAELFDVNKFDLKYSAYFSSSKVYSVLKNLELLVGNWDGNKIDGFRLEEACSNDSFRKYYQIELSDIDKLRAMLDNGRIYFSVDRFAMSKLESDMQKIRDLSDIDSLVIFIQSLDLNNLLDDAFDTVFDKLFGQLFGLQQAFNSELSSKKDIKGVAWLRLLLKRCEHLKLDFIVQKNQDKKLRVLDWKSAWFLENKRIILLNANESVLSNLPPRVYLLTEKQLKALGVTTRDEHNELQRNRFMKMCLRNKLIKVYSVDSASEGKQTSSFVEELAINLPEQKVVQVEIKGDNYYGQYLEKIVSEDSDARLKGTSALISIKREDLGPDFVLSPSSFDSLKACPLKYYLDKQIKLKRHKLEESIDIKGNVLGNIVHEVFEEVCALMKQYVGQDVAYSKALGSMKIEQVISKVMERNIDMLPEVYHQHYAEQVITPVLKDSIKNFFERVCESKFKLQDIKAFFIEDEGIAKGDKVRVSAMIVDGESIPIKIIGRADLRVELVDGRVFIFDFKTGSTMHDEQLNFYSEFYYEGRPGNEEVKPHLYFYQVFDLQEKQAKYMDVAEKVNNVCAMLVQKKQYDFALTTQACRYCDHEGVCRKNG